LLESYVHKPNNHDELQLLHHLDHQHLPPLADALQQLQGDGQLYDGGQLLCGELHVSDYFQLKNYSLNLEIPSN
jgi:hypothetical protein